jgi:glycosyltransferase involved in cell wall biosynthesis
MKIAFVTDVLYPYVKGGAERRVWEVSRRLAARGYSVHVYCMKYWEGADVVVEDGVFLHGVCRPASLYTPSGRRRIREAIYFSLNLFTPLLKGDFDVVDCNQFPFFPLFVAKFCCMLKRKKLVATWHEVWGKKYWADYLGFFGVFGYLIEKTTARLPEQIISVS